MLIFRKNKHRKHKPKTFGSQAVSQREIFIIFLNSKHWNSAVKYRDLSENLPMLRYQTLLTEKS